MANFCADNNFFRGLRYGYLLENEFRLGLTLYCYQTLRNRKLRLKNTNRFYWTWLSLKVDLQGTGYIKGVGIHPKISTWIH